MPVPNSFANVTTSIPLSQLDANFNTPITLGNTAIQLGNTVTTLNNMTLANVTVTSGNVTITNVTVTTANVTTANIANVIVTGTGTFAAGSNTAPSITFTGDTNTGIYSPTADTIAFTEGGVESMRLNNSGNVGIGTQSPAVRLHLSTSTTGNVTAQQWTDGATDTGYLGIRSGGGVGIWAGGFLAFGSGSGTFTERARFNTTGAFVLAGGTTTADGIGITFPATQSASSNANTLDDYEEGTFEPIAIGSGVGGTGTYTLQAGRYTKIGRVCFFQFTIGWSAFTGTGDLNLGGLPFTSLGADGEAVAGQSAATVGYVSGLSFTNQPNLYIPLNNTILVFTQTTTGGVVSGIPVDTAVAEIIVNGHYIVA